MTYRSGRELEGFAAVDAGENLDRSDRMLVFDGDCGFCSRYGSWIAARLPADVKVVPWQTIDDLEAIGLTERDVECAAWWVNGRDGWAGETRSHGA